MKTKLNELLKIDDTHILQSNNMADAIYKEKTENHTLMLKRIKERLIELHELEISKLENI